MHWFAAAYGAWTLGWGLLLATITIPCVFCHRVMEAVHTPAKISLSSRVEQPQLRQTSKRAQQGILRTIWLLFGA
jgi:hypothetical protein